MTDHYEDFNISRAEIAAFKEADPKVGGAFDQMLNTVMQEGALSLKTKVLMAVSISVITRCKGCLMHHVNRSIQTGATREELLEAISVAILTGGGPSVHYGSLALDLYDQYSKNSPEEGK